jgi:hypothetical protein
MLLRRAGHKAGRIRMVVNSMERRRTPIFDFRFSISPYEHLSVRH